MTKEETFKDPIQTRKDKSRCKKCNSWVPTGDIRALLVTQKNRPIEFEWVQFTTKAEIGICKHCWQKMEKA